MKTYCIIGASAAGISAATQIRALDTSARIIIFSAQQQLPYNVCLLTHFLRKEKSKKDLQLKPLSWFHENAIDLKVETRIEQIKASEKCVVDQNGICYYYEKLLIAVGTRPKLPCWFNITMDGVFPFYSLADAEAIQKRLTTHLVKTILVIGGGINGLECADALNTCGYSVTVLEAQPYFLYQWFTAEESEKLRSYADACGVSLVSDECVTSLEYHEDKKVVKTRSGTTYCIDMVIVATGSVPATEFLRSSCIKFKDSFIVTDEYMQSSIPDIFAAGDCALVKNRHSPDFKASTRWSDAVAQGMCAGKSMSEGLIPCAGIVPGAQTTVFKQFLAFFGQTCGVNQNVCSEGHYERISLSPEGNMHGFVVFGDRVRALDLKRKLTI